MIGFTFGLLGYFDPRCILKVPLHVQTKPSLGLGNCQAMIVAILSFSLVSEAAFPKVPTVAPVLL